MIFIKYIILPILIYYIFFTIGIPLSEYNTIRSGYWLMLLNVLICCGLMSAYALPSHPKKWKRNYYVFGDLCLVITGVLSLAACIICLPRNPDYYFDIGIVTACSAVILSVSLGFVYGHAKAYRYNEPVQPIADKSGSG
jgi:hypothetical protein